MSVNSFKSAPSVGATWDYSPKHTPVNVLSPCLKWADHSVSKLHFRKALTSDLGSKTLILLWNSLLNITAGKTSMFSTIFTPWFMQCYMKRWEAERAQALFSLTSILEKANAACGLPMACRCTSITSFLLFSQHCKASVIALIPARTANVQAALR